MHSQNKTNYRNVYKSDHLGVVDVEEIVEKHGRMIVTIREVRQEIGAKVAGKRVDANIAYFKEKIKPLVLNATNAKTIRSFCNNSIFVEDWSDTVIELYVDSSVKMKGEVVGGVRVKKVQPQIQVQELTPNHPHWELAKQRVSEGMTFEQVNKIAPCTRENYEALQCK